MEREGRLRQNQLLSALGVPLSWLVLFGRKDAKTKGVADPPPFDEI